MSTPACAAWKDGSEAAAEEIIQHLYPVISKIVRTHLPRRDDERDLIQEILMKTFTKLHQYKGDAPPVALGLAPWPLRPASTASVPRKSARSAPRRPDPGRGGRLQRPAWLTGSTPDSSNAIAARDLVDRILSNLSPEDRSLVLMVDLEGRSLQGDI